MTPGSAGGELGDHGALRLLGLNHPRPHNSTSLPSSPIPPPPICFCHLGRNLRSVGSAPFTMAQHFPLSYRRGSTVQRGRGSECLHTRRCLLWKPCSAWIVVVWQTNAAVSGKCHTKGNSLLKLL